MLAGGVGCHGPSWWRTTVSAPFSALSSSRRTGQRPSKAGLVPPELGLGGRLPSPLRLHDHVEAGRDEFDIGEAPVGAVVFLEFDHDWWLESGASVATRSTNRRRIAALRDRPHPRANVMSFSFRPRRFEHGLNVRAVKAKFDHPMRVRDAGCSSPPPRGPPAVVRAPSTASCLMHWAQPNGPPDARRNTVAWTASGTDRGAAREPPRSGHQDGECDAAVC